MGDVNHSPVSVLASKQLRTDEKPNRNCDISFLIGWTGLGSTIEPSVSGSLTNIPTLVTGWVSRDEQVSPTGKDLAMENWPQRVRRQRETHVTVDQVVFKGKRAR